MNLIYHVLINTGVLLGANVCAFNVAACDYVLFCVLANFIDVDHLAARPIYDPKRCSFLHPPHSMALALWVSLILSFTPYAAFGYGYVLHLILDAINDRDKKDLKNNFFNRRISGHYYF